VRGINSVGLQRRGVPEDSARALRRAVRKLWMSRTPRAIALRELASDPDPYVQKLLTALASRESSIAV
jgi:acyl-[acyl carrier protein]--UDP-N-acetylglucosamine O-acyltransferase